MKKIAYIAPEMEVIKMTNLATMLATSEDPQPEWQDEPGESDD